MIYALVVVYNKRCSESLTLKSIEKYAKNDFKVIIFDNSTKNLNNSAYASDMNYLYYGFKENLGLSKAYNYAILNTHIDSSDYILILDDDTELTADFFEESIVKTKLEFDIILPIVKAQDMILSPANIMFGCRPVAVKNIGDIELRQFTAINSGMLVKRSVYDKIKYDENLFLDSVDHDFMRQVLAAKFNICIMTSIIMQSYSRNETSSIEAAKFRYNIFKKDFKYFCHKYSCEWFYFISMFKLAIGNCIKYRDIYFMRIMPNKK